MVGYDQERMYLADSSTDQREGCTHPFGRFQPTDPSLGVEIRQRLPMNGNGPDFRVGFRRLDKHHQTTTTI